MKARWILMVGCSLALACRAENREDWFSAGTNAYTTGDFATAKREFSKGIQPSVGALINLGLAEWQRGRVGEAVLAWEQALWIDPFDLRARNNLQFARTTAQLESPELSWYEIGSTWLPADWWAWIAGGSLWFVVGLLTLPDVLRRRRAPWQQAIAALGLGVLLLSLPAQVGVFMRARMGFVLERDVPLRLTPTVEAEAVTRLAAGEPVRRVRTRGDYVLVQTSRGSGWLKNGEFGLVCAR